MSKLYIYLQRVVSCVVRRLFSPHKGARHTEYHPKNEVSALFWRKAASQYCEDAVLLKGCEDGAPSKVYAVTVK